jgi:DNA-binding transcriptional MerR regulator
VGEERLVTSAELAKALGIHFRTVQRYIAAGDITPELRTAGGHTRWSVEKVRQQLRELNERRSKERD